MVYVYWYKEKSWAESYQVPKVHGNFVFNDITEIEKQCNIFQNTPDHRNYNPADLKSPEESMECVYFDRPPGVFITKRAKPGDARSSLQQYSLAKANKVERSPWRGAFDVVDTGENPEDFNILPGRFLHSIENSSTDKAVDKAGFVIYKRGDIEKHSLVYSASILAQSPLRLLLIIAVLFDLNI